MNKLYMTVEALTDKEPVKGKVWIGDPCYVCAEWEEFCDTLWKLENNEHSKITSDGVKFNTRFGSFYVCGTKYGDGCYPCTKDGEKYWKFGSRCRCTEFEFKGLDFQI